MKLLTREEFDKFEHEQKYIIKIELMLRMIGKYENVRLKWKYEVDRDLIGFYEWFYNQIGILYDENKFKKEMLEWNNGRTKQQKNEEDN